VFSWRVLWAGHLERDRWDLLFFYFQIQKSQSFALAVGNLIISKTVHLKGENYFHASSNFKWAWRRNGNAPPKAFLHRPCREGLQMRIPQGLELTKGLQVHYGHDRCTGKRHEQSPKRGQRPGGVHKVAGANLQLEFTLIRTT
jgi:hypothetical protein